MSYGGLSHEADDPCVNILSAESRTEAADTEARDHVPKANGRIKFALALAAVGLLVCAAAVNAPTRAAGRIPGTRAFLHAEEVAAPEADPYVVVAIFSGRGERMRLLLPYVNRLRSEGKVHEVHLWDFTRYDKDRTWIATEARQNKYKILNFMGPRGYGTAYDYYAAFSPPTGAKVGPVVVVKVDDDIVYLDLETFANFTKFTANHPDMLVVHSNVVNNGVAAYYQFTNQPALSSSPLAPPLEVYPDKGYGGNLWASGHLAGQLHELFLQNPTAFRWGDSNTCIEFHAPDMPTQGRFSLNFFAARQQAWVTLANLVNEKHGDDEDAVTTVATANNFKECMYTTFNSVHLSFFTQAEATMYALRYEQLAEKQGLHPLPGLDDPCAVSEEGDNSVVQELLRVDHAGDDLPEMPVKGIEVAKCRDLCKAAGACKGIEFIFEENADTLCYLKADVTASSFTDPYHCLWVKPSRL